MLLEREASVASRWRRHYDRLHLHTNRALSGLPYLPMPRHYPRYPSRLQVVEYMEHYADVHGLEPRFQQPVRSVRRQGDQWLTATDTDEFRSRAVVVATGFAGTPVVPDWPGLSGFPGSVLHSSDYRNGKPFRDQDVLVVGFGNSGGEIALDLVETGARPVVSVRSPVNVIPRDLLGMPILATAIPLSKLPPGLADVLSIPLLWPRYPSYRRLGLRKAAQGPFAQIRHDRTIPLLDIGTIRQIRRGKIRVRQGVRAFHGRRVEFADGSGESVDAVVLATGYRPAFEGFLEDAAAVVDARGVPLVSGGPTALPGLYFCGFFLSPTGMLREIGLEARRLARILAE